MDQVESGGFLIRGLFSHDKIIYQIYFPNPETSFILGKPQKN